jgi:hypothetical protein
MSEDSESARRARKSSVVRSETASPPRGEVSSGSIFIVRSTPEDQRTPNPARAPCNVEKSPLYSDRAQVPSAPRKGNPRASVNL